MAGKDALGALAARAKELAERGDGEGARELADGLLGLVGDAAYASAKAAADLLAAASVDYYRATEALLRAWPRMRALVADRDSYLAAPDAPPERSKDVVAAAARGGPPRGDADDILADMAAARREAYLRTYARFAELDRVFSAYAADPRFAVIRMYYFGEALDGGPRLGGWTWEDLAEELDASGLEVGGAVVYVDASKARRWRAELIKGIAIAIFGTDAALALTARRDQGA